MLNRLRNILNQDLDTENHQDQLENVIEELTQGVKTIKNQCQKIATQEKEIISKLHHYEQKHKEQLALAKKALKEKRNWLAESLYTDSEIIKRQVKQYQRIASETQKTKRKLLAQEHQMLLTIDELSTKKALGEANVDAAQLKAELSEQLMFLKESDELNKFDDLILEAEYKSQAIAEIQDDESSSDEQVTTSPLDQLQQLVSEEQDQKRLDNLQRQQKIIDRVFGKLEPEKDEAQKDKQRELLQALRQKDTQVEKKDRINNFFDDTINAGIPKSPTNTQDKEDRIKHFFK